MDKVLQKKNSPVHEFSTMIDKNLILRYRNLFKGISTCLSGSCLSRFSQASHQIVPA